MKAMVIPPKIPREFKFLSDSLKKLDILSSVMTEEEVEDLGYLNYLRKVGVISVIFIFFSLTMFGQRANLQVEFAYTPEDSFCYKVCVFNGSDTIVKNESFKFSSEYYYKKNNLPAGDYTLCLYSCKAQEQIIIKKITLLDRHRTEVYISLDLSEEHYKIDSIGEIINRDQKSELQFSSTYLKSDWINGPGVIKTSYGLGFTMFSQPVVCRHFGILIGGGLGLSQHFFSRDTSFANVPTLKERYENYTYVNGHVEAKFRISQANQKLVEDVPKKLFMDIGVLYNIPIVFKQFIHYEDSKMIINNHLHQYTDTRVFVNIGFYHVSLFCEYRLFDFILGAYPELPTYNAGIKIMVGMNGR
jgi:hypothetical protein